MPEAWRSDSPASRTRREAAPQEAPRTDAVIAQLKSGVLLGPPRLGTRRAP